MTTPSIRVPNACDIPGLASLRGEYAEEQRDVSAADDRDFECRFGDWYSSTAAVSCWRVAELERTLVGVVHMFKHLRMPMPNYDPGGWGYVSLLYVQPEHRGNGLGARLLQSIEQEAGLLGFSKVLLNPTEKAAPLYHRCGYRPADSYLVHKLAPTAEPATSAAADNRSAADNTAAAR